MNADKQPVTLIGFLCNWCSYAGADLAGVSRFQYDTNIRIVRLPCSGRMDPLLALKALQEGADGVLISGCHPGDCHYSDGNYFARRRFAVIHDLMEFLGLDSRRLQISWVSASEGRKWADVVTEVADIVRQTKREAFELKKKKPALVDAVPETLRVPPTCHEERTAELRAAVKKLLESGAVKAVLGHGLRPGGQPGVMIAIVRRPEEVTRLAAFDGDTPNLSRHLAETIKKYGPTAFVGKGADLFSAINLVRENQIKRNDVKLIGLSFSPASASDPGLPISGKAGQNILGVLQAADLVIGEKPGIPRQDGFEDVAFLDSLPRETRAAYWEEQFGNCIRCYACRNACPSCYCKSCFADSRRPTWVFPSPGAEANRYFHLIRAYHLAGRCAACGECERVCPMSIPLFTLARKAQQIVRNRFGHVPSGDPGSTNPMSTFQTDDQVEFIL